MTWPPIIRVFFAISFTPAIQHALHQVMFVLKKHTKHRQVQWTRTEKLHITLKFIPTLNMHTLPALEAQITTMLKAYRDPLLLHAGPCITFPLFFRPRIIAMDVQPAPLLAPIAGEITTICDSLQLVQRDQHDFHPHITLGRIKHPKDILPNDLMSCTLPNVPPIEVTKLTLFCSEPTREGPHHYTVIKHFPIGYTNNT